MRVFVAGAGGRVGRELVDRLVAAGHEVVAGCRSANDVRWPDGVEAGAFDLHGEVGQMAAALEGCDAVCFTAGSRGKDLLQVDAFGAVKLMQAAEQVGAKRFVMLSSFLALEPERWKEEPSLASITNYNIAKFFADEWLMNTTDLDWTIVQPGVLEEKPATGKIEVNPAKGGTNPIPDVAEVLAQVLERPNTVGKVIMMHSGDEPIAEALQSI